MSALALAQPALPALAPDVIDRYAGPYAWLSNGASSPVQLGRFTCATVEHGFNAAKTLDMAQRAWVIAAPAPFGAGPDRERWGAKKRGRHVTLRPGWDEDLPAERLGSGQAPVPLKVAVMQFLLRQKFYAIPELGRCLLATGDATLIEGNTWHDNFWGRCTAHARREDCPRFSPVVFARHGDNWLGRLQMQIRAELAVVFIQ
jgi:predicted NAD-dependent protein-ADP-ribosyltransferase YbiA (DUF1768 family)